MPAKKRHSPGFAVDFLQATFFPAGLASARKLKTRPKAPLK
jgi:hypothetical protein